MHGIIFDFNGTMFQDSDLHELAWAKIIKKYTHKAISSQEIMLHIHGHINDEILRYFISNNLSAIEVQELSDEKELLYRELCLENPDRLVLTKGLEELLIFLAEQQVPMTIATATVKENVEFYFELFKLNKWFDFGKVLYDDGSFPGKPAPDIFLKAADKIKILSEKCVVVEDAYSGVNAAIKANIGKIYVIDPHGVTQNSELIKSIDKLDFIQDFSDFPRTLF